MNISRIDRFLILMIVFALTYTVLTLVVNVQPFGPTLGEWQIGIG